MSTVAEIRAAIQSLTIEERAELLSELCDWTDDEWDQQMKRDAAAGKFAKMNADAASEINAGTARPLSDLLNS